jgi:ribosomal protein S18 acetylase RimI-like enzyme
MAAITAQQLASVPQLRSLNIVRDLPGVADLVEKCFADTMDTDGQNYIQQMRRAGKDNTFLRWASRAVETASLPLSGYVWEENGEIIGNVSLIPYRQSGKKYYLIANVAVRQEYRKRGIGRTLTMAAMIHARQHHSDETWLHVREDNPGAISLYRSLGFLEIARRTTWQAQPGRLTHPGKPRISISRRNTSDWITQETWLRRLYPDFLAWHQPIPWNAFRPGVLPAIYRFMLDQDIRHWVARINGYPSTFVSWEATTEHHNRLWIAIPPEPDEDLMTELLLYARQQILWRDKTSLDFPAGQNNQCFEMAGFHLYRTLLWMKSDETSL